MSRHQHGQSGERRARHGNGCFVMLAARFCPVQPIENTAKSAHIDIYGHRHRHTHTHTLVAPMQLNRASWRTWSVIIVIGFRRRLAARVISLCTSEYTKYPPCAKAGAQTRKHTHTHMHTHARSHAPARLMRVCVNVSQCANGSDSLHTWFACVRDRAYTGKPFTYNMYACIY